MRKVWMVLSCLVILVACSPENAASDKEPKVTKEYMEENAEIGLTYEEVRERFGKEDLADVVDSTETWLYDSTQHNDFSYDRSLEAIASDEIKSGDLDYQLYINFIDEKAFMYSYFYKGDDGKVWQLQLTPDNEPLTMPVGK